MKTIKTSKLKEVLTLKGVNEGFVDRLFEGTIKIKTKD